MCIRDSFEKYSPRRVRRFRPRHVGARAMAFVELSATTNFTFLTGASHPEEMIAAAAALGMPALAVADLNSVAGIVRAHTRAREMARDGGPRIRLLPAARIVTREGLAASLSGRLRGHGRLPPRGVLTPDRRGAAAPSAASGGSISQRASL